jgi:hypothetical protein
MVLVAAVAATITPRRITQLRVACSRKASGVSSAPRTISSAVDPGSSPLPRTPATLAAAWPIEARAASISADADS